VAGRFGFLRGGGWDGENEVGGLLVLGGGVFHPSYSIPHFPFFF